MMRLAKTAARERSFKRSDSLGPDIVETDGFGWLGLAHLGILDVLLFWRPRILNCLVESSKSTGCCCADRCGVFFGASHQPPATRSQLSTALATKALRHWLIPTSILELD